MFYSVVLLAAVISGTLAGYSGSSSRAGNGVDGTGQGFGYAGTGTQGQPAGNQPGNFPQVPYFDFNNFLSAYFDSLRNYHEQFMANSNSYAYTANEPNSDSKAESSLVFDNSYQPYNYVGDSLQQQQNSIGGYGFPGGFPAFAGAGSYGGFQGAPGDASFQGGVASAVPNSFQAGPGGSYGGGFQAAPGSGGAVAGASLGPDGGYQTAAVYPENPGNPNIQNRFTETGAQQPGNGGFYGVFTSSHSSTSDIDGKKTSVHEAETTINDNGKVTTYKVKNP